MAGQAGPGTGRDRLPAHRDLGACAPTARPRPCRWLHGLKANAGEPHLPGQRDASSPWSTGARRPSGSSTSTTGTGCAAEVGRPACTRRSPTSPPGDPGYVLDVSGAAVLKSSHHQAGGPAVPGLPRQSAGPGDHRPQRQLRVPDRLGGHDGAAGESPLRPSCSRTRSPSPNSATGRPPWPCCRRSSSCEPATVAVGPAAGHDPSSPPAPRPAAPGPGAAWLLATRRRRGVLAPARSSSSSSRPPRSAGTSCRRSCSDSSPPPCCGTR